MIYSADCNYSIRLLDKLHALPNAQELDFGKIKESIIFAKQYHSGQFRKSGEPFYSHPLEVAFMIVDYIANTNVIVASILHDVIEDTEATAQIVMDIFGSRVAEIVELLTRDKPDGVKKSISTIIEDCYLKQDFEALTIKLLDRLHNIKTLSHLRPNKQIDNAYETIYHIAGAASAMNLREVEEQLMVLSEQILHHHKVSDLRPINKYDITLVSDSYQL